MNDKSGKYPGWLEAPADGGAKTVTGTGGDTITVTAAEREETKAEIARCWQVHNSIPGSGNIAMGNVESMIGKPADLNIPPQTSVQNFGKVLPDGRIETTTITTTTTVLPDGNLKIDRQTEIHLPPPVVVTAAEVTKVTYGQPGEPGRPHAYFQKFSDGEWIEYKISEPGIAQFWFVEERRDGSSVYIFDKERKIRLQLNLHRQEVWISHDGKALERFRPIVKTEVTALTSAPPRVHANPTHTVTVHPNPTKTATFTPPSNVTAQNVTVVAYGLRGEKIGTFDQMTAREWQDNQDPNSSQKSILSPVWYSETRRGASGVYLFNAQTETQLKLDLQRMKVLSSYQNAPYIDRYDILSMGVTALAPEPPKVNEYEVATAGFSEEQLCLDALRGPRRQDEPNYIYSAKVLWVSDYDAHVLCDGTKDHKVALNCMVANIPDGGTARDTVKTLYANVCKSGGIFASNKVGTSEEFICKKAFEGKVEGARDWENIEYLCAGTTHGAKTAACFEWAVLENGESHSVAVNRCKYATSVADTKFRYSCVVEPYKREDLACSGPDIVSQYKGANYFLYPCKKHDVCYSSPWRKAGYAGYRGKLLCDDAFRDDMQKICDRKSGIAYRDCVWAAEIFRAGVSSDVSSTNVKERDGDWSFDNGQRRAEAITSTGDGKDNRQCTILR